MSTSHSEYSFEPLSTGIKHANAIMQFAQNRYDEDFYLLFNIEPQAPISTYCRSIKRKISEWKNKNIYGYLIKHQDNPVGIVRVLPIRAIGLALDSSCDIWSVNKSNASEIVEAYQAFYTRFNAMQLGLEVNIYSPLQNKQLAPLPFKEQQEGTHSLLTYLSGTMPDSIPSMGSDFLLRRFSEDVSSAKQIYELMENNREMANRFLGGLSSDCSTIQSTTAFLSKSCQISRIKSKVALFYGLYKRDECIGLCQVDCESDQAEISLLVDKQHNRKGYGSETIRLIERELFRRGIGTVRICCDVQNYASASAIQHNRYTFDPPIDGNENETFYYYHKTAEGYAIGAKAPQSLLKSIQLPIQRVEMQR